MYKCKYCNYTQTFDFKDIKKMEEIFGKECIYKVKIGKKEKVFVYCPSCKKLLN